MKFLDRFKQSPKSSFAALAGMLAFVPIFAMILAGPIRAHDFGYIARDIFMVVGGTLGYILMFLPLAGIYILVGMVIGDISDKCERRGYGKVARIVGVVLLMVPSIIFTILAVLEANPTRDFWF